MKKIFPFLIVLMFATGAVAQQSLGEIARQARAQKRPSTTTVRFDDESMLRGTTGQISVVGQEKPSKDADQGAADKATDGKAPDAKASDAKAPDAKDQAKPN